MRMKRRYFALVLGLLFFLSVGCSQQTPEPAPTEGPSVSVLATPTASPTLPPVEELTPKPGQGLVRGLLYLGDQPAPERVLYLASIISSGGDVEIAALDAVSDPRTETDGAGRFVFLDIAPGRYALGINSPVGPVLIRGADGDEITAEVTADQIVDLGTVTIVSFNE